MATGVLLGQKDSSKLPLKGGTMQGAIDMQNNAIKGLPEAKNPDEPITKEQFDKNIYVTRQEALSDLYNTKALKKRVWSDGTVEYFSTAVAIGREEGDLLGYALSAARSGYQGTIEVQLYQSAIAPVSYCMAQIITSGLPGGRLNVFVYGFQDSLFRNWYNDETGEWSGWVQFRGVYSKATNLDSFTE